MRIIQILYILNVSIIIIMGVYLIINSYFYNKFEQKTVAYFLIIILFIIFYIYFFSKDKSLYKGLRQEICMQRDSYEDIKKPDKMTGIIGGVSITKLKSIDIPSPPLKEQKRIVAKIEELMPYVDKYDVAYSKVEELNKKFPEDMQKSILKYAIQGKLVEQREEDGRAEDLYK